MAKTNIPFRHNQSGITLIVGLIMLLLITMIGVNSMQDTTMQERMAMNVRDKNLALQGAESALRAAEESLTQINTPSFNNTAGYISKGTNLAPNDAAYLAGDNTSYAFNWNGLAIETSDVDDNLKQAPQWIVEEMDKKACGNTSSGSLNTTATTGICSYYRVTARSFGLTNSTQAILQTTVRFNAQ